MKDNKESESRPRKPYTKPEVKKVQLKPEEAVLGFCKVSGSYGPVLSNCQVVSKCKNLGS